MAKRKSSAAKADKSPAEPPPLSPVAPPRKRPWLLALSILLLAAWLVVLAGLALFGEAKFGE
jgi:hypothetical protein